MLLKEVCSTIVEHILKLCPDLDNKINNSVLNVAVRGLGTEYREIIENLLRCGFTVNPKDANNFEELLKHGADVNMLCNSASGRGPGYPLHVATRLN